MTLAGGLVVSVMSPAAWAAEGEFSIGSQWWDQTAPDAKYQEFSQVPRGGFLETFVLREWAGRNSVALWGANAIQSNQASKLTWANGARYRVDLGYTQIPHTFSRIARWGWTQTAPGVFTIPDTLQDRNQAFPNSYTGRMTDFLRNVPVIGLGFNTNISNARLRGRPVRDWQLEARGTVRERSGLKPYALDFGFSTALENPEPIDQRMVDADVIASYQHARLRAQASVGLSSFDNAISTLRVDNPKRNTDATGGDGARVGALDLYPDNKVARGSVALAYLLPKRTAVAATLGMAQTTQDDPFLPFTTNTRVDGVPGPGLINKAGLDSLPARSLDGKAVQLNGDVRLTTRPVEGLDGAVRFHYDDYDNQTEERVFIGQAPYEASWQRFITVGDHKFENHARSNTQWTAGLDLDYDVTGRVRLGGTYELRTRERTEREVEKDEETVIRGRARARLLDGMEFTGRYSHGDRKLDEFLLEEYEGLTQRPRGAGYLVPGLYDSVGVLEQPSLRRFDVANRVQDQAVAGVACALGERVELSATYSYLKNDYPDSKLGLQDETQQTVSSTGTVHVNDRVDLNGGYGFGLSEANQASRSSGQFMTSLSDSGWSANLKDTDVFYFAGFEWAPKEKLTLSANYQLSRNVSEFDLDNGLKNAADLPNTLYRRHEAVLDARWQWLKSTVIVGRWGWEEYDTIDWASNNVPLIFPVTGTANAIFLGDSSQSYKAHRLALLVKHSF